QPGTTAPSLPIQLSPIHVINRHRASALFRPGQPATCSMTLPACRWPGNSCESFWRVMSRRRRWVPPTGRRARSGARDHEGYEMQFLISMHINPAVLEALSDEEKAAIGERHGAFLEALKKSGELITTQALVDPSQAAVVSVRNGQPVVTDGPFLESKEYLGGFYLID